MAESAQRLTDEAAARAEELARAAYGRLLAILAARDGDIESAEDCLVREVREEVAVEVKNIQYVGSQCWPFPHSMMLGFHAEYAGGEIVMQPDEIEDAKWFSVHDLPPLPAGRSIARYLIDLYVARRLGLAEPVLPR